VCIIHDIEIISCDTKEGRFSLCLFVCLFVCLLATSHKEVDNTPDLCEHFTKDVFLDKEVIIKFRNSS